MSKAYTDILSLRGLVQGTPLANNITLSLTQAQVDDAISALGLVSLFTGPAPAGRIKTLVGFPIVITE